MTLLVLISVLSQSPLPAGQSELPPNHPATAPGAQPARPLSPGEEAAPLPPGHPRIDGTSKPAQPLPPGADTGQLPPNHPPINGAGAQPPAGRLPSVEELIKKIDATPGAATADRPFEMSLTIGRLYLTQGRMKDAAGYYEQAVKKAQPVRDLYEAQQKLVGKAALPAPESVDCAPATLDALFAKAKAQADAKKPLTAAACARAALGPLAEAELTLGHAKFMAGDSAGALQVYERTLATFGSTEAHYAHAALLVDFKGDDVKTLQAAKAELEKVLKDAPTTGVAPQAKRLVARADAAIKAGGMSRLIASTPPPAPPKLPAPQAMAPPFAQQPQQPPHQQDAPPNISKETMEAFQNAPRTAELEASLQKLVDDAEDKLAKGQFQDALNDYRGVMPYQPDNPRVRAGMAWTLIRLNKQPMAERVWGVATGAPDAIAELGDRLKSKGDAEGAKALWQKLAESVPSYAPKLQGKL